jgi:hypothetical protein
MTIMLNVTNEALFEKILHLLNRFKNDGLEIITPQTTPPNSSAQHKQLPQGFLKPLPIEKSYSAITTRDALHER